MQPLIHMLVVVGGTAVSLCRGDAVESPPSPSLLSRPSPPSSPYFKLAYPMDGATYHSTGHHVQANLGGLCASTGDRQLSLCISLFANAPNAGWQFTHCFDNAKSVTAPKFMKMSGGRVLSDGIFTFRALVIDVVVARQWKDAAFAEQLRPEPVHNICQSNGSYVLSSTCSRKIEKEMPTSAVLSGMNNDITSSPIDHALCFEEWSTVSGTTMPPLSTWLSVLSSARSSVCLANKVINAKIKPANPSKAQCNLS